MDASRWKKSFPSLRIAMLLVFPLMGPALVLAERLPIRTYTTSDGLAQNAVNQIVRDSRGFLWFCTEDGLSRYDGYTFTNYGVEQGLPNRRVRDLLVTQEGEYWVATGGGLCRFNPQGRPWSLVLGPSSLAFGNEPQTTDHGPRTKDQGSRTKDPPLFEVYYPGADERSGFITALWQDRSGVIWCGTQRGLFRVERQGREVKLTPIDIGLPDNSPEAGWIHALCQDRHGALWIGAASGLYRRWPDGRTARYFDSDGLPPAVFQSLCEDSQGNLWAGTRAYGLFRLVADPDQQRLTIHRYTIEHGLSSNWIFDVFQSDDGRLWVATNIGLCEYLSSGHDRGRPFRAYPMPTGLGWYEIVDTAEDSYGNLWLATNAGAMKLTRSGFTTYGESDGFISVVSVFENASGELCFVGSIPGNETASVAEGVRLDGANPVSISYWRRLGRFDGRAFTWLRPNVPRRGALLFGWGWNQTALQDRDRQWWIIASDGLYLFPPIKRFEELRTAAPRAVYTVADGLASPDIFRLYEDSRGDVWISTISPIRSGLARWDRATRTLRDMSRTEGLPSLTERTPISFREDRSGNLWVGFSWNGLARYRDGRFAYFTSQDGAPDGWIYDLLVDGEGRLWIASTLGGLARVDDPSADRPTFVTYTTAHGLSSNKVTCLAEDRFGRVYIGTARGLDRLDPATDRIKRFTSADGLISGEITALFCDRNGDIWAGGAGGLARLVPRPDQALPPPSILITGLHVAGNPRSVSALGETAIDLSDLAADESNLQIDFVGLSFAPGESLRYRYQLDGADRDWSAPTAQRAVNYANLAPGRYQFLVQAVNTDGVGSSTPATVTFAILPPLWQRWWVLMLAMLAAALAAYAVYRYRLTRLLELERVRTRIAADLHDDIGSNLSRIALLAEVVRQQMPRLDAGLAERLALISSVSRESVDAMSDIVWAINPNRDRLSDLIQRMRRFAEDTFQARNIAFRFDAPHPEPNIKPGADMRREVFLIFKESVNNMVRHSACTEAEIDFRIEGGWLVLKLSDNGKGLDLTHESEGQGLLSMRQRAKKLGGELEICSLDDQGTTVTLRAPLR